METFNRHTTDLIARAVVSGRRGYGKRLDRIADAITGLMTNRLEAAQAPGALHGRPPPQTKAELPNREILDSLFRRIEKHLASLVLSQTANGRSQTR